MQTKFIRIYTPMDVKQIKPNLLVYGDLGGQCEHCGQMDVKLNHDKCPKCGTEFKYISFRNIKVHFPKVTKLLEERPNLTIVDFEDYKKEMGASKAGELFK